MMEAEQEEILQSNYFLVIDDNAMCRMVAAGALRREFGIKSDIDQASAGAKALEKIMERTDQGIFYRVISCDFNLGTPDTGADVIFAIRQLGGHYGSVPIRCVTEQVDDMKAQLQQLFQKPADELLNITFEQKDPKAKIEVRKLSMPAVQPGPRSFDGEDSSPRLRSETYPQMNKK
jgi:CheY-like chemotaxis protein